MASVDIIVFGSAIVDFICYCPRLPRVGETLHGVKFCTGFGGKGANQCVAAARLGAKTAMIANLGSDQWGESYFTHLEAEGVNVQFVNRIKGESTGIAAINVAENGDNQIVIITGANKKLTVQSFNEASAEFSNSKVLICQLETPVNETIQAVKLFKGVSILNAAPAIENAPRELLSSASILCVNESEAALMTGIEVNSLMNAKEAISRLIELGANTVILTMGEHGVVYSEKTCKAIIHVPVEKVDRVLDTTGAGDAFIGALAFFIAKYPEKSLANRIGAACEIAAISVQHLGTQSSFPYAQVIEEKQLNHKEFKSTEL